MVKIEIEIAQTNKRILFNNNYNNSHSLFFFIFNKIIIIIIKISIHVPRQLMPCLYLMRILLSTYINVFFLLNLTKFALQNVTLF